MIDSILVIGEETAKDKPLALRKSLKLVAGGVRGRERVRRG